MEINFFGELNGRVAVLPIMREQGGAHNRPAMRPRI
jgi:hypothetical protein